MSEILEHRMFGDGKFTNSGTWKSKTRAKKHAEILRNDGFKVRTVTVPIENNELRYVNYIKK